MDPLALSSLREQYDGQTSIRSGPFFEVFANRFHKQDLYDGTKLKQ